MDTDIDVSNTSCVVKLVELSLSPLSMIFEIAYVAYLTQPMSLNNSLSKTFLEAVTLSGSQLSAWGYVINYDL